MRLQDLNAEDKKIVNDFFYSEEFMKGNNPLLEFVASTDGKKYSVKLLISGAHFNEII